MSINILEVLDKFEAEGVALSIVKRKGYNILYDYEIDFYDIASSYDNIDYIIEKYKKILCGDDIIKRREIVYWREINDYMNYCMTLNLRSGDKNSLTYRYRMGLRKKLIEKEINNIISLKNNK